MYSEDRKEDKRPYEHFLRKSSYVPDYFVSESVDSVFKTQDFQTFTC